MSLFLFIALTIWLGLHAWLLWRTHLLLRPPAWAWRLGMVAVGLLATAYVAGRILVHTIALPEALAGRIELAGALWMALVAIVATLMVLLEAASLVTWVVTRLAAGRGTSLFQWLREGPGGARWAAVGLTWGLALAGMAAGAVRAAAPPEVLRLELQLPSPPPGLRRLVQVSDLHLGAILPQGQWEGILETIVATEPDALLLTGDIVEDHTARGLGQIRQLRARLPGIPFYMSLGNHERYAGPEHLPPLASELSIQVLRQDAVDLGGLWLGAVDDPNFTSLDEAASTLRGWVPKDAPLVVMSHQPQAVRRFADRARTLVLAGHVHGGQVPPFQLLAPLSNGGYRAGLYRAGDAHLHLSRGAGTWGPPVRLFAPPDVVVVELAEGEGFTVSVR